MQDRFTKIMLVVIAALLAANLFTTRGTDAGNSTEIALPNILISAQAQSSNRRNQEDTPVTYKVSRLEGFAVEDLQDVVSDGDGRSFVVSNSKGFMVYQVNPSR